MSLVPPENPFISRGIDQYVWETHMESTSFSRDLLKVRGSSVIRPSRRLPKHSAFRSSLLLSVTFCRLELLFFSTGTQFISHFMK